MTIFPTGNTNSIARNTGRRDYEVNQITWNSGHQVPQSVYDRMSDRDWGSIYDAANEVVA